MQHFRGGTDFLRRRGGLLGAGRHFFGGGRMALGGIAHARERFLHGTQRRAVGVYRSRDPSGGAFHLTHGVLDA